MKKNTNTIVTTPEIAEELYQIHLGVKKIQKIPFSKMTPADYEENRRLLRRRAELLSQVYNQKVYSAPELFESTPKKTVKKTTTKKATAKKKKGL